MASSFPSEVEFYASERKRLFDCGIVDYDQQSTELKERWERMATMRARAAAPTNVNRLFMAEPLTIQEMHDMQLNMVAYNGCDEMKYVYAPIETEADITPAAPKRPRSPSSYPDCEILDPPPTDFSFKELHQTRKREQRLLAPILKRLKKPTMQEACDAFDIPYKKADGKDELAENLAEFIVRNK